MSSSPPALPSKPESAAPSGSARTGFWLALLVLAGLLAGFVLLGGPQRLANRLLIAPMIGGLDTCLFSSEPLPADEAQDPAFLQCRASGGSAAPVIADTLKRLDPQGRVAAPYELGYTLYTPLLKLFVRQGEDWVIDAQALQRLVATIARNPQRLVLYLFSTHFPSGAAIEPELAADANNLAWLPTGPMARDKYYGLDITPWSVARTDNGITQRRLQAISAIAAALCQQPASVRERLAAITLLGETHQLFPSFEAGMGFDKPYRVSDYSAQSIADFQAALAQHFGDDIGALNRALGGSRFTDFKQVQPPQHDIRQEPTLPLWQHLDSYADGRLVIAGWQAPDARLNGWLRLYLNGRQVARVQASLARQDVLAALPDIGTAEVGWRHDLDFRGLPSGDYQLSVLAEATDGGAPWLIGERHIQLMPSPQSQNAGDWAPQPLPAHRAEAGWRGSFDLPGDGMRYYYNPLAALWQNFRGQQVVRYLRQIEGPLQHSCLADVPRYIHQLIPFPNPSWDDSKYAVEPSLEISGDLHLGVSLYGEAADGQSFLDWKQSHRRGGYGITEFHPLHGMDAAALGRTLQTHRDHGARFLSFFLEGHGPHPAGEVPTVKNFLSFDPNNPQRGSDALYRSMQQVLAP